VGYKEPENPPALLAEWFHAGACDVDRVIVPQCAIAADDIGRIDSLDVGEQSCSARDSRIELMLRASTSPT
jgi:hypothetical protein